MTLTSTAGRRAGSISNDRVGAVVALVVFAALRCWLAIGKPVSWSDTHSYDVQASKSLFSARFWAGRKPPGFPLLLKLVGSHETVIVVQVALSIVAWALLAWVVASVARTGWPRLVALCAVLLFAVTTPIAIWDRVMLSESLAAVVPGAARRVADLVRCSPRLAPARGSGAQRRGVDHHPRHQHLRRAR